MELGIRAGWFVQALGVVLGACVVPLPQQCVKDAHTVFILQSIPLYCVQAVASGPIDMFPAGTVVQFTPSMGDMVVATPRSGLGLHRSALLCGPRGVSKW